jgi:hypothetical protein
MGTLSNEYGKSPSPSRMPVIWISLIIAVCVGMLPLETRLGAQEVVGVAFFGISLSALYAFGSVRRWRSLSTLGRHAVAGMMILVTAGLVTPTPDVLVLLSMAVPLWVLYGLAVAVCHLFAKKSKKDNEVAASL